MKLFIATLTLLAGFSSQARSLMPLIRYAQLPQHQLDVNHFQNMTVKFASISIDETNHIVRLRVRGTPTIHTMECRATLPGGACEVPEMNESIDLPIVKDVETRCGRMVTAVLDARPVDGNKQTLQVNEFVQGPRCLVRRAFPKYPTSVEFSTEGYNRFEHKEEKASSYFQGNALRMLLRLNAED